MIIRSFIGLNVVVCVILSGLDVLKSQTFCNSTHPINLTITIEYDVGYDGHIRWYIMKDSYSTQSGKIVASRESFDIVDNLLVSESVCVENGCYWVRLEDVLEANGLCCDRGNGWYDIKIDNQSILWMDKTQTFEDDFDEIYFCSDLFMEQTQNLSNLTIVIDYDTQIKIENTSVVSPFGGRYDTIGIAQVAYDYRIDAENIFYQSNNFSLFINDGCYQITMYQETSDVTESPQKHGDYLIFLNDEMRGIGGYYSNSESHIICTHPKHISSCINPHYCDNKQDLFVSNFELFDSMRTYVISAVSYGHLYNSTLEIAGFANTLGFAVDFNGRSLNCLGAYSCHNISLQFVEDASNLLHCDGYLSCMDIYTSNYLNVVDILLASEYVIQCNGIKSCVSGYHSTLVWNPQSIMHMYVCSPFALSTKIKHFF